MSKQRTRASTAATAARTAALIALISAFSVSTTAVAGPSAQHIGAASSHSAAAVAHSGTAAAKGVSAVAAVPLIAVGGSAMVSAGAGSALYEFASEPLRVGHQVIHTAPPATGKTPNPAEQMGTREQGQKH